MNKLYRVLKNPWILYERMADHGFTNWIPDELHLKAMYRAKTGLKLNLDRPSTYNEKLQWIKLHDRNPVYNILVDKYRVKQWVAERIGAEHVTQTFATWQSEQDIDISNLPDRFVLKTNHDCGGVVICKDRSSFNLADAKKKLREHLANNYYWRTREWPYKDVRPCVFAEEYLDPTVDTIPALISENGPDATNCPADYKISCFGGEPALIEVHFGRFSNHTCNYFTPEWNELTNLEWDNVPKLNKEIAPPPCLDQMIEFSSLLTKGFPQMRADWYVNGGRLIFGELTLFSDAGFGVIDRETDAYLGSLIDLNLAYTKLSISK